MEIKMTVIGITGPSGAGKGEVSGILAESYGFQVIDADKVYHILTSSPSECLDEIRKSFGDMVISGNALDRHALSKLVFGEENRERLTLLNSITHKYVVREIKRIICENKAQNIDCIIDAPLLIEAGLQSECDFTISVIAKKETRIERISARDNISLDDASLRIASQKPDIFYTSNTDYTISNDSDRQLLKAKIDKILAERRIK